MNDTQDYITGRCPQCKHDGRLYIQHGSILGEGGKGNWLECPSCDWVQDGCYETADAAVEAYEDMPLPPAPPTDYLKLAHSRAGYGDTADAAAFAAIAQAEAMTRMAEAAQTIAAELRMVRECVETLLDTVAGGVQP